MGPMILTFVVRQICSYFAVDISVTRPTGNDGDNGHDAVVTLTGEALITVMVNVTRAQTVSSTRFPYYQLYAWTEKQQTVYG